MMVTRIGIVGLKIPRIRVLNVTLEQISKAVVPYIIILTLVTVLLTAVPEISLWLPRLLR